MPTPASRGRFLLLIFCLAALPALFCHPARAQEHPARPFSFTYFQGWETKSNIVGAATLGQGPQEDLAAGVALGWRFAQWRDCLNFELEGMLLMHGGSADFRETGAVLFLRWTKFPWNHWVNTTLAAGEGMSYTCQIAPYEGQADNGTRRLLNLIVVELSLAPPLARRWAFVFRIHHRSRAWGLYAENGESNFLTFGLKWRF